MVEFKQCPDCGSDTYPNLDREHYESYGGIDALSQVRANCKVCGWRTLFHKSVKGCADEWNKAKVNE